jgi:hypothetical protein
MTALKRSQSFIDGGILTKCVEATALTICAIGVLKPLFERASGWTEWAFVPYWLVMVIMACRFGLPAGICSATAGVWGYFQTLAAHHQGVPDLMALRAPAVGFVALFGTSGLLIGWLTRRIHAHLRTVLTLSDRLHLEHEDLASRFTLLMDEQQQLARQVIAQEEPLAVVARLFASLDTADAAALPERVVQVASALMLGGKAAVYHFEEGSSRGTLVAGESDLWPKLMPLTIPVVEQALRDRKQTAIAQLRSRYRIGPSLASGILLASPIHLEGSILVLLMSDLHLAAFTPTRLGTLAAAMQVAARTIARELPNRRRPLTAGIAMRVGHAS